MPVLSAVLAVVGAAGCRTLSDAGPTDRPVLARTEAWAGSPVLVHWSALPSVRGGIVVLLGDRPIPTTRLDDSTLAAAVPADASGPYPATLRADSATWPLDVLTVYGFSTARSFEVELPWDIMAWPPWGHATVLGGSPTGLTRIDVDDGRIVTYDSIFDLGRLRGPGLSYRDGVFLLWPRGGDALESWRLLPAPERLARHPGLGGSRQVMQLGPDVWFVSAHHEYRVCARADSAGGYQCTYTRAEETEGVVISPRADRATIRIDYAWDGVPVFAIPTGEVAYRVPDLIQCWGAAFSPDGDMLVLGGPTSTGIDPGGRLLAVRATTGEVVRDTSLERSVFAVAFDAVRPLLYVGLQGAPVTILVLHRETFAVLGQMAVPTHVVDCGSCYKGVLAQSAEPALYLVHAFWGSTTSAWRFSLPHGDGLF